MDKYAPIRRMTKEDRKAIYDFAMKRSEEMQRRTVCLGGEMVEVSEEFYLEHCAPRSPGWRAAYDDRNIA